MCVICVGGLQGGKFRNEMKSNSKEKSSQESNCRTTFRENGPRWANIPCEENWGEGEKGARAKRHELLQKNIHEGKKTNTKKRPQKKKHGGPEGGVFTDLANAKNAC